MTGDGAVVRELVEFLEHGVKVSADVGCHKDVAKFERFIAAIRQQAAEIERLTTGWAFGVHMCQRMGSPCADLKASEARTADLLKALERYGAHDRNCEKYPKSDDGYCYCGLEAAAAKGETV